MATHFLQEEHEMHKAVLTDFYFNEKLKKYNTNPFLLDLYQFIHTLGMFAPTIEHAIFHYLASKELKKFLGVKCCHDHHDKHKHSHKDHICSSADTPAKILYRTYNIAHWSIHLIGLKALIQNIKQKSEIIKELQRGLTGVSKCIKSIHAIKRYIQVYDVKRFIPLLEKLEILFDFDEQIIYFTKLLESKTFTGNPSVFSHIGAILAAYEYAKELKQKLSLMLDIIAELDGYLSITHLFNEYQNKSVRFNFVNYLDADNPTLILQEMWNPSVALDEICPQSICLGYNNFPGHAIITGPNGGGKSTILKSISLSIILAQTIGIAPMHNMVITPYKYIMTSFVITDSIETRTSLFMKEISRTEEILSVTKKMAYKEFAFIAIDELFRSTVFEKGQDLAYDFIGHLGTLNNTTCVIATHFPKLTLLETETAHLFQNFTATAEKEESGVFKFIFKKGASNQDNVFDILHRQKRLKVN